MDEGDRNNYLTETQREYIPRESDTERVHDLRRFQSSHFAVDEGYNEKPISQTREALAATAGLDATTKAMESLHLKKSTLQLADNDKFTGQSETRDAYREKDDVKAAEMIRPERQVTKLNVCFPSEDGARESEMRASYVPLEAAHDRTEA